MNILFVLHERNLGGGTKSAMTLMKELAERGHKVVVVLPIKCGQVYKKLKQDEIVTKVIFFGWWMMPNYWPKWMKVLFRLLYLSEGIAVSQIVRVAQRENIQIVHSNSSAIDVGARAAQRLGVPHVWHVREYGDLDYRLMFLRGKEVSCKYMSSIPGKIVFISQSLRNHYRNDIPDEVCEVIYNGIASEYLMYKEMIRKPKETVCFLVTGNLQRNKRQDLAIEACRILKERGISNYQLVIAGTVAALKDSIEYERELKNSAEILQAGKVIFTGYVTDMNKVRKNADVELVCSSSEAFGRVTIEAMMASNPVIASNSGACPELIQVGKNGWLFEAGNAKSLADYMESIMMNPECIGEMGAYAYKYAKEMFTSFVNTDNIEKVYQNLL